MQWHTQEFNITTNMKVKIDLTLPEFSATKTVTCKCNVYDSANGGYYIILSRYILTELLLNLKLYEHLIEPYYGPLNGSSAPMVY